MVGRYQAGRTQAAACPECFAYTWLRDFVATHAERRGTCPYCRRRNQLLAPVSILYDPFQNLISSYHHAEGPPLESGRPIINLIQADWDVFSERLIERGGNGRLLEAIMHSGWDDDSGEGPLGAYDQYACHRWSHETLENIWDDFVQEVGTDPTRPLKFRDAEFHELFIREDLVGKRRLQVCKGAVFYRARLGFDKSGNNPKPYAGHAIGAPPTDRARPGRANGAGKVVLYCADQEHTAVAEMRPTRGEYVSIAEAYVLRDLEILDLAPDPEWPNPFTDEIVSYRVEFARLLNAFAEQLAMPLRARDDKDDYIPTQKLATLIEQTGLHGIRYPSAMAPDGTNVVLFNPSFVEVGASRLVEIVEARIQYQEVRERRSGVLVR